MSVDWCLGLAFWMGPCGALYAYGLFPLWARWIARRNKPRCWLLEAGKEPATETVTVIVPAYNEEGAIKTKLENVLSSDWPRHLLEVIVVSDASTDRTDDIVRSFEGQRVSLVVQDTRRGKSAALNRAMSLSAGGIVVFTDANAVYPEHAIARMVGHFRDSRVGLVTGYTKYTLARDGTVTEATNLYTRLERAIKRAESVSGNCVGADGAVFGVRRSLCRPLRDDDINDFVIPLGVIEQGKRCVLAEGVFCTEQSGKSLDSEFRRQSRITNRTLRALWRNRRLLNPCRFPLFSIFLLSHKVGRLLVPWSFLVSGVSLFLLMQRRSGALAGLGALSVFGIVLVLLVMADRRVGGSRTPLGRAVRLAMVFVMMNLAILHGWCKFLSGRTDTVWQHDRSAAGPGTAPARGRTEGDQTSA